jgi:P-type Ca2+ transporter type 2C
MDSVNQAASDEKPLWHLISAEETLLRLGTNTESGLSGIEAEQRLARHGRNVIPEGKQRGTARMLLDQFTDFMILVLIAAAAISGLIGDVTDTYVILAIILLNALIGFVQEYRAQRAIAALRTMAAPSARVTRDRQFVNIAAAGLVPGDIVHLEAGNVVPADLRFITSANVMAQESALTGESLPVSKETLALQEPGLSLGDRLNMAYKGTLITHGHGLAVVVVTGDQTELGKIAQLLHAAEDVRTPLQNRLARFGRVIALSVIALCVLMFVVGILRGEPVVLMLLTAISLAVAAIPEALPAVVTISLALGAAKMVKKNALIRRLAAVETLGSVTYICSDKTGTLTLNKMHVEELFADGRHITHLDTDDHAGPVWQTLFHALALSNDTVRDNKGEPMGDPTEIALTRVAEHAGYSKNDLSGLFPRIAEIPFDAERKCMTTLHTQADGVIAFVKGAPEKVLAASPSMLTQAGPQPLDHPLLIATMERMAAAGLRVLALAVRHFPRLPEDISPGTIEQDLTFLGLVGMLDPPRSEAQAAVALCRSAGIVPVMITGDHPATARAIAERIGILEQHGQVLTGRDLAPMTQEQLKDVAHRVRVYARVSPEQKINIVQALQAAGEFVAMTGDGVNDAPALKQANIGIAMGITGTDVAKEASDMILLDDNFATIVSAVREGRRIFDNIRKFIKFVMTGNSGEIFTIFLAPFVGLPIPLLPVHILWVNLVTDGLPGLALSVEKEEPGIMQRPPRPPDESIFAHGMWQHILWVGLLIGALCLLTQAWAMQNGSAHWQTMVFTVLTLAQMLHVLAIRSEGVSLFTIGIASNLPLLAAIGLTFVLQLMLIYVPMFNVIFKTSPLSLGELGFCLLMSSVVFVAVEIEKMLRRRGWLYA